MAYCTETDLLNLIPEAELAELTAETGDDVDSGVVTDAIGRADAVIDGYLAVRYTTPVSPVPEHVKALSMDIAAYHLYSRRSVAPEVRRQKYEDAINFLKDVVAGRAAVVGAAGAAESAASDVTEITSSTRVFSRDNLSEW